MADTTGRRAADTRSAWDRRKAAGRAIGEIRRVIAEQAVAGQLPELELVQVYRERLRAFDEAHADWMHDRQLSA